MCVEYILSSYLSFDEYAPIRSNINFFMDLFMKYTAWFTAILVLLTNTAIFADEKQATNPTTVQENLKNIEKVAQIKIGVYAIDTNTNQRIAYRADEYFPVQSTLKLIAVGALFKQSDTQKQLLEQTIYYTRNEVNTWGWHPITGQYIDTGMTLKALAGAAITYSDNPAANLIIKQLGGSKAITAFAHSMGNDSFNLEHYDGADLNSNPNKSLDSATPKDMAISVYKLTLSHLLTPSQRALLVGWMQNNTVGYKRIRAGVPNGWTVADKTGSGDYGIANDIGIVWSPVCKPIVLAIYTVGDQPEAGQREDLIGLTTKMVLNEFATTDSCFSSLSS